MQMYCKTQEPAKLWEKLLLSLEVPGSEPGVDAVEEITPKTEKVTAAVWYFLPYKIINAVESTNGT